MEMKELKEGMVVLAKPDRGVGEFSYYIGWFQEILKKNIRLTVILEAKPPNYEKCVVISDRGKHKGIPFDLMENELGEVVSGNYRRF